VTGEAHVESQSTACGVISHRLRGKNAFQISSGRYACTWISNASNASGTSRNATAIRVAWRRMRDTLVREQGQSRQKPLQVLPDTLTFQVPHADADQQCA
jgi:hypothetical protein